MAAASGSGWLNAAFAFAYACWMIDGSIRRLGHISRGDLDWLYKHAVAMTFPSLFEGFGLPVLEAMLAGCPVITSRTSSLPEVAGDAGMLVDPLNAHEIAAALALVLGDEELRQRMSRAGRQWALHFSWEQTAWMTQEVYLLAANR